MVLHGHNAHHACQSVLVRISILPAAAFLMAATTPVAGAAAAGAASSALLAALAVAREGSRLACWHSMALQRLSDRQLSTPPLTRLVKKSIVCTLSAFHNSEASCTARLSG